MSYLFSQANQYNPEGRAQIILIWMVLMEIIRVVNDNHSTWQLRKSLEQLVRLFWVGFLVYSYAPLHGLRRVMIQDDLPTIPMSSCNYIVMGEEKHEIAICNNGYHLGKKKYSTSDGMLMIGRVFHLNLEDEAFTSAFPNWRDNCVSLALANV
ncbi:hypothetical protein FCM35_KLT10430 [Carex littledalei]|uniref:Uncharacterized protein n=1 Tax=Carex littledalei TaxID=544730 RepID=A0A833QM90_9POAL|nr:hypothetical protein FCM35_KLT10430 [Carex littledalei]